MLRYLPAALAVLLPVSAAAHDGVSIRDAHLRSANPASGAIFMVIENHRAVPCRLRNVSTDGAARAQLHTTRESGGVMTMVPLSDGIEIPPGGEHALARGGDHVMLLGLTQPARQGDTLSLTMDFGDCGTETVEVPVDNRPEAGSAHDGHAAPAVDDAAHVGHGEAATAPAN